MEIALQDAQAVLPSLLERAAGGEEIIITGNGQPLAQLTPISAVAKPEKRDNAKIKRAIDDMMKIRESAAAYRAEHIQQSIDRIERLREGISLPSGVTVCDLIKDGRRY